MSVEGISIRCVDEYDTERFRELVSRNLESHGVFVPEWDHLREADPSFEKRGRIVRIAAFDGATMIGISWGQSASKGRFSMQMSLVEPAYRRRGIYSAMLDLMLEETRDYDEIDSHHHMHNNAILIAKLARGFVLVGFDLSAMIGPRVQLRLYRSELMRELFAYRAGLRHELPSELLRASRDSEPSGDRN